MINKLKTIVKEKEFAEYLTKIKMETKGQKVKYIKENVKDLEGFIKKYYNFKRTYKIIKINEDRNVKKILDIKKNILIMKKNNEKINFNYIAKKLNISKSFLYSNNDIKELITSLKAEQNIEINNFSESNKNEIQILKKINKKLKEQLKEKDNIIKKLMEKQINN